MGIHTEGPWVVSAHDLAIRTKTEFGLVLATVVETIISSDGTNEEVVIDAETGEANARLMAAAPELLGALQLMERNSLRADWPEDIYSAMVSAIAKATGESA